LVSDLGKEGILVTIKSHTVVALLSTVGCQRNCLRSFSVGVLDVYIVELRVGCRILNSPSSLVVGCTAQKTGTVYNVDNIARVGCRIRCVAVDCESCSS
jgi:hypothetical protein